MKEMLKEKATIGFICLMVGIFIICPTTKLEPSYNNYSVELDK